MQQRQQKEGDPSVTAGRIGSNEERYGIHLVVVLVVEEKRKKQSIATATTKFVVRTTIVTDIE